MSAQNAANNYLNKESEMECVCCLSTQITPSPFSPGNYYLCADCGLIFRQSTEESRTEEDAADHYQSTDPHQEVGKAKLLFFRSVLSYLSRYFKEEKRSILDIGCGYGYFLEQARKKGWHTTGTDIYQQALQDAKESNRCHDILCGSIKEAGDSSFDVVTLWDVIMLFPDPAANLAECFTVLKPGGKIGIRVRNVVFQKALYRLYSPFRSIACRLNLNPPYVFHPLTFSSKSIHHLLARAGFVNITIVNSPLSSGDPYKYSPAGAMTVLCKRVISLITNVLFRLSRGGLILGPSLLAWADKPLPKQNG